MAENLSLKIRHQTHPGSWDAVGGITLPPDWRELTVDEEITLRTQLPPDMRGLIPHVQMSFGQVDQWLESGFSGSALLIKKESSAEITTDEEGIARIKQLWQDFDYSGSWPRQVLSAEIVELGPDQHPAIECLMRSIPTDGARNLDALEFYAPTGGDLLILSFRSWEDDFPEAVTSFRTMADSLTFARPPQGPEELADRLFLAVLIGLLIGALLLAANKARRAREQ